VQHYKGYFFLILLYYSSITCAQVDSLPAVSQTDTSVHFSFLKSGLPKYRFQNPGPGFHFNAIDSVTRRKRIKLVIAGNIIGYSAVMVGLYSAWYADYPQSGFHTFNDWPEWKQVDKAGHFYSAYIESMGSMEMWRWTGIERKKRIWLGGMSGAVYQTVIEVLDGFSEGWGWSWGDFGANILGSAALVSQELAWNDQRIRFKFSFHKKKYDDPELNTRSDKLFGDAWTQRFLKDYNGQTYWASVNLHSFFPASGLPRWLNLSIGYGAEGMFGGTKNIGKDAAGNIIFNRPDIKRYRQWYLSPDIDFSKISTNSRALRLLFTFFNAFKFPAPAIELSNGKLRLKALAF
jgi:uncharacterized protein YfiM (DUF2279 family)